LAEPAEENHFFTFRHARQRRIPFVFKDLDIIAPDFLGKVLKFRHTDPDRIFGIISGKLIGT